MAVLMLCTIDPRWVPEMEGRGYLPMEIASIEDLWFSANEVIHSCMGGGRGFGWHEEGEMTDATIERHGSSCSFEC